MTRVVLSVEAGAIDPATNLARTMVRVVRSPFVVEGAGRALEINLNSDQFPAWEQPDAVKARGIRVRDSLLGHPGVAGVLAQLGNTPKEQSQPLYVMLSESDAELINWETLCNARDAFVALDRRWPIGRITDPINGTARPAAELQLPARLMALISAFGIKGQVREWEMLRDALAAARAAGFDLTMKVLVGDPALRAAIDAEIAGGLAGVEVAHIDKTPSRVLQEVAAWSPHILHFFCHGRAELGDQSLELATAGDYADVEATEGSVRINARQLEDLSTELSNPWVLVLNCCSSGQAARNLHSIAHQVVSAGFPAAVAMSEPVDATDAYEFSGAFYRSLFVALHAAAKKLKAQPRVLFEWAEPMYYGRTAIRDLHKERDERNLREWALPVLYVRGVDAFQFERPHAEPEPDASMYKVQARMVAEWLQNAARNESEERRKAVMAHALAGVPKHYWPALDGSFPNE